METTSAKETFSRLLPTVLLPNPVDIVFVLRHIDPAHYDHRIEHGLAMIKRGWGLRLITPYEPNTWGEATHCMWLAKDISARSIAIVTEEFHMPRAFLTFVRAREMFNNRVRLYPYTIPDLREGLGSDEEGRILAYRSFGHVASYEEGVEHLCLLLNRDSSSLLGTSLARQSPL